MIHVYDRPGKCFSILAFNCRIVEQLLKVDKNTFEINYIFVVFVTHVKVKKLHSASVAYYLRHFK